MNSLLHQVGAYAVRPTDISAFLGCGFTLALMHEVPDPASAGLRIIDTKPLQIWRAEVLTKHKGAKLTADPVVFTASELVTILNAIEKRVIASAANPAVVGFYIQDDYIGNVRGLHERIVSLIQTHAPGRRIVQGFGCTLDYGNPAGGYSQAFTSRQHYAERELLNYVPGCDALLYVYSYGKKAPTSDFAMTSLMPWMLTELHAEGWDPASAYLIGGPQCWQGVPPSAAQVREQTAAFARFGASAICAFTWGNFTDGQPELRNSPDMRAGLVAGMKDAQAIWART